MRKIRNILRKLWTRLKSETPKVYVFIQGFLLSLASTCVYGLTQLPMLPKWHWLEQTLQTGVALGLIGTFMAQMATTIKKNQEAQKQEEQQQQNQAQETQNTNKDDQNS